MVDVTTIQSGTVFAWFMLLMVLRRVVMLVVAGVAARGKPRPPGRVPEDYRSRGNPAEIPVQPEFTKDMRVNKTITNDTENDTYFLILLLATAYFSDPSNGNVIRTIVYGAIYLFARICFAIAYIMGWQPWRSLCFALGLACTLACSLDLVITMSRRSN
ncbi:unnamed protein product [Adineta steineri]|uniref:Microsomal glutathione S-transferase 1 n=1 Tax=Adineta steineri TaxID=433720 RepID=A0A813ZDH4_9BILA|nr:unnamed protein product [Adineta steineri]CAF3950202.1 unnamed protein product [Adineta steineri]